MSNAMEITFTKLSLTHHRVDLVRDDGTRETAEFETRSAVPHDFIHYALESLAGLHSSVWGLLASGHSFADLGVKAAMAGTVVPREEVIVSEMVAGALSSVAKGGVTNEAFLEVMQNAFGAFDLPVPAYLTHDFLNAFRERMRELMGYWKAVGRGEPMRLEWPAPR